ncbi:hypothetical protein BD779DRAFT_1506695 [Infundibulicybe gibba]|nr:hypothetical protein BD779DRAFT_1506695 [Infundibulicybe gibba]
MLRTYAVFFSNLTVQFCTGEITSRKQVGKRWTGSATTVKFLPPGSDIHSRTTSRHQSMMRGSPRPNVCCIPCVTCPVTNR